MGIGFDVFKANVGWRLADGVVGSISDAIEKNAMETAIRQQAEKEQVDRDDMLKAIVFMVGNKVEVDRNTKKGIASMLSTIYDKNISLFSVEEEIDTLYSQLQSQNLEEYFSSIEAINTDRRQVCFMYEVVMLLYMGLDNEGEVLPAHSYNLALIKRFFRINRSELAECYAIVAEKIEMDTDDVADFFEELISEEAVKKIEGENPHIAYKGKESFLPVSSNCERLKETEEVSLEEIDGEDDFRVMEERGVLKSQKKKSVAILLCLILFGAFGLHRFYVGKTKSGGLILLLSFISSGVVGAIWGCYDLFTLIFTDKFTDADGLPLR